ncbi:hypothetical protein FDP41_013635 [Naegleria fowleri]|uniref:Uncharacterized protein n=1 Tax=Naegleria fowleri TaxID=5763 RepID=A0A6A5C0I4_NAEFO|nr:uncharacterized protein FDP41_013635 [Naegleria fowleri]KAF0980421.1 hypothetical protein FDP41_013635 [Naegleria fowleri]CAG4710667.1 unnamed protein product [Naegleria fowleri]
MVVFINVACECLLIASCLFSIRKIINSDPRNIFSTHYTPKNPLAFIILFASIAFAACLGIINYASLNAQLSSYHPIVSRYVASLILPLLLPLAVIQSIGYGPIQMTAALGQVVITALIAFIGVVIYNEQFNGIRSGLFSIPHAVEELLGVGSVIFCLLYAVYGYLTAGSSASAVRFKCLHMIYAVVAMIVADSVLKNQLLSGTDVRPFERVDLFHIIFSLAMIFLGNVAVGSF